MMTSLGRREPRVGFASTCSSSADLPGFRAAVARWEDEPSDGVLNNDNAILSGAR
jgi:hypothetical protein